MTTDSALSLAALEARLAQDLDYLGWPGRNWMPARQMNGEPVLDVAIIGGGQAGLAAWVALMQQGIRAWCSTARPPAARARGRPRRAWKRCARPRS